MRWQADKADPIVSGVASARSRARLKICGNPKQRHIHVPGSAHGQALNSDDALPIVEEISASVMRTRRVDRLARLKNKDDYLTCIVAWWPADGFPGGEVGAETHEQFPGRPGRAAA